MLRAVLRTMALCAPHMRIAASPACAPRASLVRSLERARCCRPAAPLAQRLWWGTLSPSLHFAARALPAALGRPARRVTTAAPRAAAAAAANEGAAPPKAPAEGAEAGAPGVEGEEAPPVPGAEGAAAAPPGGVEDTRRVKTKAMTKKVKHIMAILNKEALAKEVERGVIPDFRPGDVLAMKVEVPENKRRVSVIRGIVIGRSNAGINSTFRIRRVLAGVGVEMVFPLYSPNIKELKVVDHRKARRAKLYYLRDKIARLSTVN